MQDLERTESIQENAILATIVLATNSHRGFETSKTKTHQVSTEVKSNLVSGVEPRLRRNDVGPHCSGKERDAESGNDYFGARSYWNGSGRWLSVDPVLGKLTKPQRLNRYTYVLNDPINFIDPDGRFECAACYERTDKDDYFDNEDRDQIHIDTGDRDSGGNPGPDPAVIKDQELLLSAKSRAIAALGSKDCLELFGTETTRKDGFNPADLLNSLADGGKFGQIKFENKGADWGVAETRAGLLAVLGLAGKVTITINSFNDASLYWNDGDADENARTLLHELGHAFNYIKGAGGFAISNSSERGDKYAYDKLIEEKCIPKR